MKVVATQTQDLYPVNVPFELTICWKTKRGCDSGYWFTPTGKGKIGFGSLRLQRVGDLDDQTDKEICTMMKKYKTDILTDGRYYYTRGMGGLAIITDGYSILFNMCNQWTDEGAAQYDTWEYKKEYLEHLEHLAVIKGDDLKKIVGYQVTNENKELHPDMEASFCLYNKKQALEMISDSNEWRLDTIHVNDIEEPTTMFKGDPRKQ